jgi:Protein of unknown function (DUF4197)
MKKILSFTLIVFCASFAFAQFPKVNLPGNLPKISLPPTKKGITNDQAVAGLKEALSVGTDTAVSILTKADGFFKDETVKILLPPEAQNVYKNATKIPGGKEMIDKTVLAMNRAAEDASKDAAPIFKNAITSMTVSDGMSIVKGADNSATTYLKDKTYSPLKDAFKPKIQASLSKPLVAGVSAEESYKELINTYNKASMNGMLFDKIASSSLSDYVTTKGLDGLFIKVADQEQKIRKNPIAQVTELLKTVFGSK